MSFIIHLDLLRNGLHSLYHGVEHLGEVLVAEGNPETEMYDAADGTVSHRTASGGISWSMVAFSRPPKVYGIKFAILHLIHAVELLVKAHLSRDDPNAILEKSGSDRSITMKRAVNLLVAQRPYLLDPNHLELVLRASEYRNAIEHAAFRQKFSAMKSTAIDFLAIGSYFAATLHEVDIADVFSYDAYSEQQDEVGDIVSRLLTERTSLTDVVVARHAAEWAAQNPNERLLLCLSCGARGASGVSMRCVVCGDSVDADLLAIIADLETLISDVEADRFRRGAS